MNSDEHEQRDGGSVESESARRPEREFEDPLENYDPKVYRDPLERTLAEERVDRITSTPFVTVTPETSVSEGLKALADLHVACLMVHRDNQLVGIFSEWDVLQRVAGHREDLSSVPVSDVMTRDPLFVYDRDTVAMTLAVMALGGCRHVPVLDLDEKIVGIVSPHRLVTFLQEAISAD